MSGRRTTPAARARRVLLYLLVLGIAVFLLFPIYWAAKTAVSPDEEIYATPAAYIPHQFTTQHFANAASDPRFTRSIVNSVVVGASVTVISILLGAFAAYALGRLPFRGRASMRYVILAMSIFPQIAILGSLYKVLITTRLYNTLPALIGTYLIFILPFTVWTLASFFQQLPKELEEAAYTDGASSMQTFWRVMMPLAAPGLAATAILSVIAAWNEYLFALSFESDSSNWTVPVMISNVGAQSSAYTIPWGDQMAASLIVMLPVIALVLLLQRWIVAGLTGGSVKG
jgi:trehalose/maltose transport system permease protein